MHITQRSPAALLLNTSHLHTYISIQRSLSHLSLPKTIKLHNNIMASASDMGFASQDYNESMPAQYNFANQFDLENPEQARASYMRFVLSGGIDCLTVVTNLFDQTYPRTHQVPARVCHKLCSPSTCICW